MTDRELEMKLKAAVERTAPDGLSRLLAEVNSGKGVIKMEKKKKKFRWAGLVAACLAIALLGGLGGFWYGRNYTAVTVVSLDVNPSIELSVNRAEKVLKCSPLNEEARQVLSSMDNGRDLEGAKLDVAVNAIVGAIVREGYLDSVGSAILISVDDKDADRGARLQAQLVATVDGVLKNASSSANVMSQNVTTDSETAGKAQQYGISTGKAAYIEQILALNANLDYAKLAELSVEELRDLIRIGAPAMPIGKEAAGNAAEEYAGVNVVNSYLPQYTEVDPELDDPTPHYDVEINYLGHEYEYEIDAFTGEVLRGMSRIVGDNPGEPWPEKVLTADEAFNAAAEYFTAHHPELNGNFLNIENRYVVDGGWFEIEFWCCGYEFDYDVDGATGAVLREETDYRYSPPATDDPTTTQPPATQPSTPADIGAEAAKEAALKHAGLTAGEVTFLHARQDYEDGKLVYDVDFYTDANEYDYEIDAATGAVLKSEVEKRPGTTPNTPATTDIGEAAAKEAALKRAGVSGSVDWLKVEHDYDNGRHYYELEFEVNATVYDCDVDAATGDVVKFESEPCDNRLHDHGGSGSGAAQSGDIGAQAAKDAALAHAGLSESQVTRLKCEKDRDDGRTVYEVEFKSNGYEYEYKIDAATGAILEHERDRDD